MNNMTLLPQDITLGVLAGGKATRLDGLDKAWIERDGVAQIVRWQRRFAREVGAMLVSANADLSRYAADGMMPVEDRVAGLGPISGLDALAQHCGTPWLLTLPVDLVSVNDGLLSSLMTSRGDDGARAMDDDGLQPLVALWRRDALRAGCAQAHALRELAIHALQARLRMTTVMFDGLRFGNLNTFDDLHAVGVTQAVSAEHHHTITTPSLHHRDTPTST